jgi:hypothetical protein
MTNMAEPMSLRRAGAPTSSPPAHPAWRDMAVYNRLDGENWRNQGLTPENLLVKSPCLNIDPVGCLDHTVLTGCGLIPSTVCLL